MWADADGAVNAVASRERAGLIDLNGWIETSPYVADFTLDLCRALTLIEVARRGGSHLILVDDAAFGAALAEICRRAGIPARYDGPRARPVDFVVRALWSHAAMIRDWVSWKIALRRHQVRAGEMGPAPVCLMSWGLPDSFSAAAPVMRDRYLGVLPAWLRGWGLRSAWLVNPAGWLGRFSAIARNIASAHDPAMVIESLSTVGTLVRALWAPISLSWKGRRQVVLAGVDLSPIANLALCREVSSGRYARAFAWRHLAQSLRKNGLVPRAIIYPFENQPWEQAMLSGFRRNLPETILIGCQCSPFAPGFTSFYPALCQWYNGTTPDFLVAMGESYCDDFLALGAPTERIVLGGALRSGGLLDPVPARLPRAAGAAFTVFAACPMDMGESLDLARKAAAAVGQMANARLVFNIHPMVPPRAKTLILETARRIAGDRAELADGPAIEILRRVDVLLYNSSGVAFEAAACGVPAVYVHPTGGLGLDKMPPGASLHCHTAEDIRHTLDRLLADPGVAVELVRRGREGLRRCFSRPDPEVWRGIVERALKGRQA